MGRLELSEAETELQRSVAERVKPLVALQKQHAQTVEEIGERIGLIYREALVAIRHDHPEAPPGCNFAGPAPERGKGRSALVWDEKPAAAENPAPAPAPPPETLAALVDAQERRRATTRGRLTPLRQGKEAK